MKNILPSITSEVLITQKCNLNCKYCFEKNKSQKNLEFNNVKDFLFFCDSLSDKYLTPPLQSFYLFGGEPLLNTKFLEDCAQYIEKMPNLSKKSKESYLSSIFSSIITNGTLIDKHIDLLKRYNASLQVSLDGPKEINDKNRVDYNNIGHFDQIYANLQLLKQNNIDYNIHGAISKNNYPFFKEIVAFHLEDLVNRTKNMYRVERALYYNFLQIVFEDDISDKDISTLLEEFYKTVQYILTDPVLDSLPFETRKRIAEGFLARKGGKCASGVTMFSYDDDFNVFPCHRSDTCSEDKSLRFFNLESSETPNFRFYETFQLISYFGRIFGAYKDLDINSRESRRWFYWCPSTNFEVAGNAAYVSSKYDVLVAELQNFIPELAKYFNLDLNDPIFKD